MFLYLGEYVLCGLGGVVVAAVLVRLLECVYEIAVRVGGGI